MNYLGDFLLASGVKVPIPWNTTGADGASITRGTNGSIRIYKDNSTTPRSSSSGITDTEDFASVTGVHLLYVDIMDNADAGFFATGHDYFAVLASGVIDGKGVNYALGCWSIQNRVGATGGSAPSAASIRAEMDSNSTQLAAIKAQTDNLPSDPADASDLLALFSAFPAVVSDKFLGRNLAGGSDGGHTVSDSLKANRNKVTIDPITGVLTVYEEDGTTVAWTGTVTRATGIGSMTSVTPDA